MTAFHAVAWLAAPALAAAITIAAFAVLRRIDAGIIAGLNGWDDDEPFSDDTETAIVQAMRVANDNRSLWIVR